MELLNSKFEEVVKSSGIDLWNNFESYQLNYEKDDGEKVFSNLEVIATICHQSVYETTEHI